ncbi:MAG: HAMP domain-containing protein [Nitrospinae bacterium]|nr:HAMP domain-containing protein [Nitrospinota bacterium]
MSSVPSIDNLRYSPLSEEQVRRKKIRTRRIIVGILLSLAGLTALEVYILQQRHSGAPIANNIAILVVFNVIIVLLFVLLLLITRNLVKLYNERKSKILGSKFQTKLIVAFLILALFPSIFLFLVASKLFSFSVGHWFSLQVERSLEQSMQVAREYYAHLEKSGLRSARAIEGYMTQNRYYLPENRPQLSELVAARVREYGLSGIVIYDSDLKVVVSEIPNPSKLDIADLNYLDLIKKSVDGEGVSEIRSSSDKGDFMAVALPLTQTFEGKISIWGYIVTLSSLPRNIAAKVESIRSAYEEYRQQSLLKLPVSANYYVTFLLVTLLILFSAIWLGFYMARGITIPIQQLAEGTRRIAGGDLNFMISTNASDEIGLLVHSFNKMTDELGQNRKKLQHVNEDLKTTNIELERRRYYIETILENIGAGVISVDKKGRITTLNKAAKRILHMDSPDVLGSSYRDVFDPSFHEPIRKITRLMIREQKESYEQQIEIMVGDNHLALLVNLRALLGSGKKYLGMVILFEDLTQMIKAQKIAAWKEVAQGIAHEIKNPLTPIQLNTQRLRKKYYENKEDFARVFDESIRIINQEVEGMKDLLNEFLNFSRMPTPNPKPVSLHKIIDDVASLYRDHGKNVSIRKNYDPNISLLNIDGEQIRRVLINLFENALDAVDESGSIEIATRLNSQEKRVKIEFSDNGVGIPPADRDKLFLPHFTTKKRGAGLGLAIVHRIIADHNGAINVRDHSPKGTVFIIELPTAPQILQSTPLMKETEFRKTSPPI